MDDQHKVMTGEEWSRWMQALAPVAPSAGRVKRRHSDVPRAELERRRAKSKAARKSRQINRRRSK